MRRIALVVAGLVLLGWCGSQSADDAVEPAREAAAVPRTPTTAAAAPSTTAAPSAEPEIRSGGTRHRRHDDRGRTRVAHDVASPRPAGTLHRVIEVVDGDTVDVAYRGSEVSVRVIGIDTPETVHPSVSVECGGPQASATARRLLTGRKVRLVFDASQGRTDSYGRTLAYLEAPGLGDFGLAMVRRGHAAEYTYDIAYARQSRYVAAQARAQSGDRGVWNRCGGIDTPLHKPAPAPRPQAREPRSAAGGSCDPGYDPCVPPYPPDLDCSDVDGPIRVLGDDPHGLDADGDGIGCDS